MTDKKGTGGRSVPGATFVSDAPTVVPRRKKKGKRHKKQHSDATLVNESVESVQEPPRTPLPAPFPAPAVDLIEPVSSAPLPPPAVNQEAVGAVAAQNEAQDEDEEDYHDVAEEHLSEYTAVDDTKHTSDANMHWTVPEGMKEPDPQQRYTPAEWSDTVVGDLVQRTNADGTQDILDQSETQKRAVSDWFHSQTVQHFRNLTKLLQQRAIEHLVKLAYPETHDAEWTRTLRLMVWKAVVRANFFWIDPFTNEATGKPQPVQRPTGVFENHFEAFVECASERLDRIGRDLPSPEYVKEVEADVRKFLTKVEYAGKVRELQHLAFLLLFEEEQRRSALGLEDMQERIRRAFVGCGVDFGEMEFMKIAEVPDEKVYSVHTVAVAGAIWSDAVKAFVK